MEELRREDPSRIGPYDLHARLGAGGMGTVYLGEDHDGSFAAVKLVHGAFADDARFRTRFAREIEAASSVEAPWVARVVASDPDGRLPWLATEYLPGPTLAEVVETSGPLPPAAAAGLAHRLAEAIAALHADGLVHRDLKPSNVILAADGPYVIDFGIAQTVDATALTTTGMIIGTPGFMSPEQAMAEPVGPPTDVFSFAGVVVFAATGRNPFGAAGNALAVLRKILDDEPDLTGIDEPVAASLRQCFAKQPAARPTAQELASRSAAWPAVVDGSSWPPPGLEERSTGGHPDTGLAAALLEPPWQGRRGLVYLAAAVVIVVLGALLMSWSLQREPPPAAAGQQSPAVGAPASSTTVAELVAGIYTRTRQDGGGSFVAGAPVDQQVDTTWSGMFRYEGGATFVFAEDSDRGRGHAATLVLGSRSWVMAPDPSALPPGKRWLDCDSTDTSLLHVSYICFRIVDAAEYADPALWLRRAGSAVTLVSSVPDPVGATPATRHRLVIDWGKVAERPGDFGPWERLQQYRRTHTETVDLWVDEQFRPLKKISDSDASDGYRAVSYLRWGEPLPVVPPPPGDEVAPG